MEPVQRTYSVKELAKWLKSAHALFIINYDAIGLLTPNHQPNNQYRRYEHQHLPRLQQILFFRELDFSLEQIKEILAQPDFDMRAALLAHRARL